MKTYIAFLVLSILSISLVSGQTIEEKERELFKKYKVKERTKYDYKYTNGKPATSGTKTSVSTYNNEGYILENFTYNSKGDVVTTEKFGYDENGNRTYYERKSMAGAYKKTSEYNEEDKIILETGYDGSAAFKTVYKYNSAKQVTEITYYAENLLDEKRVYEYSGKSATVKVLHRGKDLKSTIKLIFDNNWQIMEETVYSLEGVELEKRKNTYTAGKIATESKYRAGELKYTTYYHYDIKGNLVKITEDSKSKGKFDKKLYSYDAAGRVVNYKWTRKPGMDYNSKTYTYGDKGVCIKEHTHYPKTDYKLLSKYEYKFY